VNDAGNQLLARSGLAGDEDVAGNLSRLESGRVQPGTAMVRAAAPAALVFGLMLLNVFAGFCVPPEEVAGLPLPPHPAARQRNSKTLGVRRRNARASELWDPKLLRRIGIGC
jgi:hypothetical protein